MSTAFCFGFASDVAPCGCVRFAQRIQPNTHQSGPSRAHQNAQNAPDANVLSSLSQPSRSTSVRDGDECLMSSIMITYVWQLLRHDIGALRAQRSVVSLVVYCRKRVRL